MDKIAKERASKDFLTGKTKSAEVAPPTIGKQVRAVLTLLAANEMGGEEAVSYMDGLTADEDENSYVVGMIHGYAIAKGLAKSNRKKKREPRSKVQIARTKMVRVLTKNPKTSKMNVAIALDNAGIMRPDVKSLRKYGRAWTAIVETRYFKTLFRRARAQVAKETHVRDCQERLELIRMGAGVKTAEILDFDSPLQPD